MRPQLSRLLTLGFLIALLVAGCGGGEEIPAKSAAAVTADLERVEKRVSAGECDEARATLEKINGELRKLPSDVDSDVRRTLRRGVAHLGKLVRRDCKQKPEPVEEPVAQPPVLTPPEPPAVKQPEQPQIEKPEKPEKPQIEKPEKPQIKKPEKPAKPEEPKKPTEEEKDICGENPAPQC